MSSLCRLPENSVKYMLFPKHGDGNSNTVSKESLETVSVDYTATLSPYISSYIWQCDPFNLQVVQTETGGYYLEGLTCFDDNIEDEWFIVYLLLQLTKEDQSLVVKIEDNDGEFLLIEAADYIPKWLNPETSENRVFLYQGSVHIIPIAKNPGQITPIPNGVPSLSDAVAAVQQFSSVTEAHTSVQQAIHKRIEGYPKKIHELQHRAHCYVPAGVAAVLKEKPHLLSSAVRAFYLRTSLDLKACRAMLYFPPETRVMTEVLFTRCLYAQLISQNYVPDKRVGWNLPPINHPDYKAHDLGMKLACGFEILASKAPKSSSMEEEDLGNHDLSADIRWMRFLRSLTDKGYFKGEIEGSRLYNHLLLQAKNFYQDTLTRVSSAEKYYPSSLVRRILETVNVNYEELKAAENNLAPPDDDSWLELTPDELESVLTGKSGNGGIVKERDIGETVTGSLKSFLHHTSGLEGAEFPANVSKKQKVALDPEAFSDAFKNILDFKVPDSDDERSSSSMSSYSYEDDSEVELGESGASGVKKIYPEGSDLLNSMKMYMKQMDQELAATDVGKSFERLPPVTKSQDAPEQGSCSLDESLDIDEESDEFRPVDIDMTALKNMLESYTSQQGLPGPASNLLSSMGVHLPQDSEP